MYSSRCLDSSSAIAPYAVECPSLKNYDVAELLANLYVDEKGIFYQLRQATNVYLTDNNTYFGSVSQHIGTTLLKIAEVDLYPNLFKMYTTATTQYFLVPIGGGQFYYTKCLNENSIDCPYGTSWLTYNFSGYKFIGGYNRYRISSSGYFYTSIPNSSYCSNFVYDNFQKTYKVYDIYDLYDNGSGSGRFVILADYSLFEVDPNQLVFNSPEEEKSINVQVSGCTIENVAVDSSDFQINTDCIGKSENCTIDVIFSPEELINSSGTLTIDCSGVIKTISLSSDISQAKKPVACSKANSNIETGSRSVTKAFLIIEQIGTCSE